MSLSSEDPHNSESPGRLRYGWNTSTEGSLWRKKEEKKNKVDEIQLANLASLGSLASNENIKI